jgi:ribokinase
VKHIVVVGSTNLDLVVSAMRNPNVGETLLGTRFDIFTGGKGANQAVAAARLGHPVYMIGKLGSDVFSAQMLEDLRVAGVSTDQIGMVPGHSGVALIITADSGQNSIIIVPGANDQLLPQDVEENRSLIENAGVILTQLETPLTTTEALVNIAWSSGAPLILDPTPARHLPPHLLRKVAWITPNETEAQLLARSTSSPSSELELRQLAEYFMSLGPQNVLLKLGERGAYLATREGLRASIPAYAVRVADTTAAGDAFNGAFAVALARGSSPIDAAYFASAVAAISVTRRGALPSMPAQADVDSFLAEQAGGLAPALSKDRQESVP